MPMLPGYVDTTVSDPEKGPVWDLTDPKPQQVMRVTGPATLNINNSEIVKELRNIKSMMFFMWMTISVGIIVMAGIADQAVKESKSHIRTLQESLAPLKTIDEKTDIIKRFQ